MGDGKFLKALHIVGKGVLIPLLYEDPTYIAYPRLFFKFCPPSPLPPPLPCHLQSLPLLFFLLSCFFGWMSDYATFDVLFSLIIIWMYTCWALVPWYKKDLDVCFMQQGIKFILSSDTCVFLLVLWFDITHTHTHTHTHTKYTQHTQGPVDWQTHINLYLCQLLCTYSSYLYYIM